LCDIARLKLGPRFNELTEIVIDIPTATGLRDSVTTDALLSAPVFTSLRHLELSENQLDDAWVVRFASAFSNASFAPTLETLNLSGNFGITDAGANVLATAPGLERLKSLRLIDTGIGHAGIRMLRTRFGKRVHF
jgi:hypothetical protein